MFILSAIHRGYTARFWQFLFLVTFSGFIVRVSGEVTLDQLMAAVSGPRTQNHYALIGSTCTGISAEITDKVKSHVDGKFAVVQQNFDGVANVNADVLVKVSYIVQQLERAFKTIDNQQQLIGRLEAQIQRVNETNVLQHDATQQQIANLSSATTKGFEMMQSSIDKVIAIVKGFKNPERWWSLARMGHLAHKLRKQPYGRLSGELIVYSLLWTSVDVYQVWYNSNLIFDYLPSWLTDRVLGSVPDLFEFVKIGVSIAIWFIAHALFYEPSLERMCTKQTNRNTTETNNMVKTIVQKVERLEQRAVSPSAPGESDADSDSEPPSLPIADTDEGKVEPERPVSPLSKSPSPVVLLGASKRLKWKFDETPTLKWAQS